MITGYFMNSLPHLSMKKLTKFSTIPSFVMIFTRGLVTMSFTMSNTPPFMSLLICKSLCHNTVQQGSPNPLCWSRSNVCKTLRDEISELEICFYHYNVSFLHTVYPGKFIIFLNDQGHFRFRDCRRN